MNKILKYTLVGMAIFAGIKGFSLIKKAKKAIDIGKNLIIDARDLSLSPLSFNLVLTNQTKESMKITKPVIEFYLNDKSVANSTADTKEYTINPLSELKIRINLKLKQSGILSLFNAFGAKKKVKYTLYANDIFYKSEVNL